jgi:hypothetical protein
MIWGRSWATRLSRISRKQVAVHRDLLAEHHQLEAEQDRKPHGSDGRSYLGYRHEIYDSYSSCETATKYIVGYGDSVSG